MSANIKSTLEYPEALFLIIVQPANKMSALNIASTIFADLYIRFMFDFFYTGLLKRFACQFALNC